MEGGGVGDGVVVVWRCGGGRGLLVVGVVVGGGLVVRWWLVGMRGWC